MRRTDNPSRIKHLSPEVARHHHVRKTRGWSSIPSSGTHLRALTTATAVPIRAGVNDLWPLATGAFGQDRDRRVTKRDLLG
jgi:hypothetical protein